MSSNQAWLLPEGIEETLPQDAWRIEQTRRALLDCFYSHGYDLVMPPLLEYLEALLTGAGEDLDLQTFKLTDQASGRTMGIRADMTPQVARIEAHYLKREGPVRLCYFGPVLLARADVPGSSREPLQFGAELYGSSSLEADVEIVSLMIEALRICGVEKLHTDIGHVGVFKGLVQDHAFDHELVHKLFGALQRKSIPDVVTICEQANLDKNLTGALVELPTLHGDVNEFEQARSKLENAGECANTALDELSDFIVRAQAKLPHMPLHFDLSELRSYNYHSGVLFSVFTEGHGQEIARGGRYDDVGSAFGRARPATGFSADMRQILRVIGNTVNGFDDDIIAAPCECDAALHAKVSELRRQGERVVYVLPDNHKTDRPISRKLEIENGTWTITKSQ